ncbi:site-specific integrase [Microbacterium sp. NEAU-LLC]|uniref:Site-specific integrase n=1 Tax=Microbacterium helvum TaxID=2773713 RepID=A0ABR8NLV3_9MICO|nr:site-specific integrase [Microbacterium helvum]MBD3941650.1 site-specific integrase [Microbacterium helvum]
MSTTTNRTGGGVSQRHTACDCEQAHTPGCAGGRCRCPREHGPRCAHRVRPDGKTACGCPWAFAASAVRAGKRVQTTGSGYSSRSAALRARAEAVETLRKAPAAARRGDTLSDWLTSWLDRRSTGSNVLRPSTLQAYRSWAAIIREAIGGERLRDVTAETLDDLERHLHKTLPGRATTHARVFAVLQSALRDAYRRGMIADDPTRRRETVRAPKTRRTMMQPEQFGRLIDWMQARGERMAPVFWVAAATGLRRGELAGLRWVDVDLSAGRLIVAQQAVQIGREVIVGAPKTATGEGRVVMLDARTVDVLRGVLAQQALDAQAWGSDYGNHAALVFANEDGSPLVPEQLTRALPRMIKRFNAEQRVYALDAVADADELQQLATSHGMGGARLARIRIDTTLEGKPLPVVTFHSLRHLHASILLASGRGLAAVQRRLGHSSITVSSDLYGHLIESAARSDAEAAAALIPTRQRVPVD